MSHHLDPKFVVTRVSVYTYHQSHETINPEVVRELFLGHLTRTRIGRSKVST